MEQATEELIHPKLLAFLTQNPDLYDSFVDILYLEKDAEKSQTNLGWEWFQARLNQATLRRLVLDNVIRISFKSNSSTHYRLVAPTLFKRTLEAYEKLQLQSEEQEPAELPTDLFTNIVGYQDLKDLLGRSLNNQAPVHFLLVGPPSTAKSLFLLELSRLPNSRLALGGLTSKQGLARWLVDNKPRYMLVDEIDKMNMEDYSSLISLMETGIVSELKVGRTSTVRLTTWVFASANRAERLPPELRSRFLIFALKEYAPTEFMEVVYRTLTSREKTDEELAKYIAAELVGHTADVRDAIKVARLAKTREEAKQVITTVLAYRSIGGIKR